MADENNFRLTHMEATTEDLKLAIDKIKENIIAIEKSNIRIELDTKKILELYTIICNSAIAFVVVNILGLLATFWLKK